nr:membrane-anchored junction protein isoform X2 [Saimiri boliviensis boliviensis]
MSLKPFTYPFPETRFLHAGSNVYKFKIRYGNSIRGEEIEDKAVIIQELEDSIRVVLGNLDNLQPFATEHFVVFPYKSKWERVSHLKFKHGEIILIPYPFVFTLYVEMKWFHENLSPGKWNDVDSREESGLAVPAGYGEMGYWIGLQPHNAQNRERKTQQGLQETLASDMSDVQKQNSEWGHSLPGPTVPPLQQSSSPPKEQGGSGFIEFLSSLFPIRYFFRKSSHS